MSLVSDKRTWTFTQKHYKGSKGFDEKRNIIVALRKGSLMVWEKSDWKRQMLISNSHLNDIAKGHLKGLPHLPAKEMFPYLELLTKGRICLPHSYYHFLPVSHLVIALSSLTYCLKPENSFSEYFFLKPLN